MKPPKRPQRKRKNSGVERALNEVVSALAILKAQGAALMSVISDYVARNDAHIARQDAALAQIGTSVNGVSGDIAALKALIEQLQNTPGEISAEDQALLDAAELKAGEAATRVESVAAALAALDDLTPPPPPTEPTE